MAKDKKDYRTMELTGIQKPTGRMNHCLTKTAAEYKRIQRAKTSEQVFNGVLKTRSDCMYVLSKPLLFRKLQLQLAWIKLGELDGHCTINLDCPIKTGVPTMTVNYLDCPTKTGVS